MITVTIVFGVDGPTWEHVCETFLDRVGFTDVTLLTDVGELTYTFKLTYKDDLYLRLCAHKTVGSVLSSIEFQD